MQFKPKVLILAAFVLAVLLLGSGLLATGWFNSMHMKIPFLIAILIIAVAIAVVLAFTQPLGVSGEVVSLYTAPDDAGQGGRAKGLSGCNRH